MGNLADNINKYKEMLELDPRSQIFALLAEDLCSAGEWQEAITVCRKGLHFYPDHLGARLLLGRALKETDQNEEAERILSSVAEEIRKNSLAFKLLSEIAAASGKAEDSAEYGGIYQALSCSGPRGMESSTAVEAPTLEELPIIEELSTLVEPSPIEEPPAIEEDAITQAAPAIVESPTSEGIPDIAGPSKPLSEWDRFKAEAIEKLDSESEFHEGVKADFENVLKTFAQRFDYRLIETAASQTIFADTQKDLLKGSILALMGQ